MTQILKRALSALKHWWRGDLSGAARLLSGLLSITYGFGFAMLLIYLHTPLDELEEWRAFVEAWLLVPPLALGAVLLALARDVDDRNIYLSGLAGAQTLVLTISAALLHFDIGQGLPPSPTTIQTIACLAPSLVAALGLMLPVSWVSPLARLGLATSLMLLVLAIALLALPKLPAASVLVLIVIGAGLLVLLRDASSRLLPNEIRLHARRKRFRLIDLGIVGVVAWLLFDPHLHFDVWHYNPYLGPTHAVLHGATMLGDVVCAYGVLPIYFLAGIFAIIPLPISYSAFSLIMVFLVIAQYAMFYLLLRHLELSRMHASLALGVAFIANFIGLDGAMSVYPSLGPMRYGLPYLLLILVALRQRHRGWQGALRIGEVLTVAAASLWSLEMLLFTLTTYLAVLMFETGLTALDNREGPHEWLQTAALRLGTMVFTVTMLHAFFAGFVFLRTGTWPHWPSYFALVGAFAPSGKFAASLARIPAVGPWVTVAFVYAASALACVLAAPGSRNREHPEALALVFGATAFGVAQFSMYVARSDAYTLSAVVMPAIFVCAYWMNRLTTSTLAGRATNRVTALAAYSAVALTLLHFDLPFRDWLSHDTHRSLGTRRFAANTAGCRTFPDCLWAPQPAAPLTRSAERLIRRHARSGENVALLLGLSTTEVLIRSDRRNAILINAEFQDGLVDENADRIVESPHQLAVGDILLWNEILERWFPAEGLDQGNPKALSLRMMKRICSEFACREIERYGGIVATRLRTRIPQSRL
jgi:hypothetical protein